MTKAQLASNQPPIRTLLVDDHAHVRLGLALMLRAFDDLLLVGQAADGEAALCLCADARPDVVVMDLTMPGMGGVAATRAIRERYLNTNVVAITGGLVDERRPAALAAGAYICLGKNVMIDELAGAIRDAARMRNG